MHPTIQALIDAGKPLPPGTRINSTLGGVPTGGIHELSANALASANGVPNHLSETVPFWILGWRDLHEDLHPPRVEVVEAIEEAQGRSR